MCKSLYILNKNSSKLCMLAYLHIFTAIWSIPFYGYNVYPKDRIYPMLSKFTIIRRIFLIILSLQMKIRFIKREPKDVNIHSLDKHYKFSSFKCIRNLLYKFCSLINRICMSHVISNGTEQEICLKNLTIFYWLSLILLSI